MFNTKKELVDFLLTSDFKDNYSNLEYKYFLTAFKEIFRNIYSENERLKRNLIHLENTIEDFKRERKDYTFQKTVFIETINNLKSKIPKKGRLKRFFERFI